MRVLVVEDDRSVRETLGMVLETYQYDMDLVADGEAALKSLETKWPDVMLLDLTLQGMSGEEVYSRIQQRFGKVPPTVVLSAAQEGPVRTSHLEGARFLAKPYTIDQLVDILESTAQRSHPERKIS